MHSYPIFPLCHPLVFPSASQARARLLQQSLWEDPGAFHSEPEALRGGVADFLIQHLPNAQNNILLHVTQTPPPMESSLFPSHPVLFLDSSDDWQVLAESEPKLISL